MRQICIILGILQSHKTTFLELGYIPTGLPRDYFLTPWEFCDICFHPRGNPLTLFCFSFSSNVLGE